MKGTQQINDNIIHPKDWHLDANSLHLCSINSTTYFGIQRGIYTPWSPGNWLMSLRKGCGVFIFFFNFQCPLYSTQTALKYCCSAGHPVPSSCCIPVLTPHRDTRVEELKVAIMSNTGHDFFQIWTNVQDLIWKFKKKKCYIVNVVAWLSVMPFVSGWAQTFFLFFFSSRESELNEMPSSSCSSFLFDFKLQPGLKGERESWWRVGCVTRLAHWGPRAASFFLFFFARGDVITRDFLNTRFIHRALLPDTGTKHQTSCLHSNCSLQALRVPLSLLFVI